MLCCRPKPVKKCPHQGKNVKLRDAVVVDGDTVKGVIGWRRPIQWSIRLYGWDCNERGTDEGDAAKAFAERFFRYKTVWVHVVKHDKYGGRLVGNLMAGRFRRLDLGLALSQEGLARAYSGHGPKPWSG